MSVGWKARVHTFWLLLEKNWHHDVHVGFSEHVPRLLSKRARLIISVAVRRGSKTGARRAQDGRRKDTYIRQRVQPNKAHCTVLNDTRRRPELRWCGKRQ